MRTELQYNLQKARALATELRVTLETILELQGDDNEMPGDATTYCTVEDLESMLDEHPSAGEGNVLLYIEPNV